MFIIILALAIIGMAALAPLVGSDSRDLGSNLGRSHPATFPALPDSNDRNDAVASSTRR